VCFSTALGALLMAALGALKPGFAMNATIAFALGMIIYIVCFELAPNVARSESKALSAAGVAIGFALVLASTFVG
jgi:zinc transporter ZupT